MKSVKSSGIANRYAKALVRLGDNVETLDSYLRALDHVQPLFKMPLSRRILVSPVMSRQLKKDLLRYGLELVTSDVNIRQFLFAMVDAGRVGAIPETIVAFSNLLDLLHNRLKVDVQSAVGFEGTQLARIKSTLESATGKHIFMSVEVDSALLGGAILRFGNKTLDLSLRSRLDSLTTNQA